MTNAIFQVKYVMLGEGIGTDKEWLETNQKNRRAFREVVPGLMA
jgi:hypothetical protein